MRWTVALIALAASRSARADDPRDFFGVAKPKAPAAQTSCTDGTAFGCASASDPLADATPYALTTLLTGDYLLALPTADTAHTAVAYYALGASRDETGPTFGGATGLENRWTIEGAPADDLRTGGAGTAVPLSFLSALRVTAGGFSARDRASTGGTVDAELLRGTPQHRVDARVWSTLSADARARPIPNDTYYLRRITGDAGLAYSASLTATGPLPARGAWYALGVAPSLSTAHFSWRAARVLDANGDGVADGAPGPIETQTIEETSTTTHPVAVPVLARVGVDRGAHHLDLTLIGSAATSQSFRGNATLQAAGTDRTDWVGDGIATWRGRWDDTRAKVQLAWHRSVHREAAHDAAAADQPQLLSTFVPPTLADDPALAAACTDGHCPVPLGYFASGGAGLLVDQVGDRPSVTADLSHRFGAHVARVGGTFEDTRLVTTSRYTGGELDQALTPTLLDKTRYYHGSCTDNALDPCDYADQSQLTYRTRYTAAYAEDTFSPTRDLRVDGGLRWELMWVGPRLHFSHELAPRLGFTWDPLGENRSRVWASFGRSFAMLPAGLGPTLIQRDSTVDDVAFPAGVARSHSPGTVYSAADGIQPMAQDEVTAGIEVGLARTLRVTVWGQGRALRRALDTVGNAFDNPGRVEGDPPAERTTELVAAEVATAPTGKLVLRVGYSYGRTQGTWPGPYDPRQGAVLYAGDDYGGDTRNLYGPLPTDSGHRAYIEAQRQGTLGPVALSFATRLTVGSGRPRDAVANGADGTVWLLPRGAAGRGPLLTQANVRLAAHWRGVDVTLDVFNLFDRTDATNLDAVYSNQSLRAIEGGSYADLVFAKTDSGHPVTRGYSFHLPTAFQSPTSAVLGVHKQF